MEKEIRINLEAVAERAIVDDDHEWGYQLRLVNEEEYCGKLLILENSESGSLHYHRNKKESFIVLAGQVYISYWLASDSYEPEDDPHTKGITSLYGIGSVITLEPRQKHTMWAKEYPAVILEVSTHDDDSDTYRLSGGSAEASTYRVGDPDEPRNRRFQDV